MNGIDRRQWLTRALAGSALTAGGIAGWAQAQAPRQISLVAKRFAFTPNEIPIKVGERVVLLLESLDYEHGFSVPDLRLRADFVPGRVTRVELQATKAGTLDFLCDNFCGDDHEDMHGRFIVG